MFKKCLVVLSEFPYPARNGITIPTSNYIKLLNELNYKVDLLLVNGANDKNITETRYINNLFHLKRNRKTFKALYKELSFQVPYFNCYTYELKKLNDIIQINGPYNLLLVSPINVTKLGIDIVNIHQKKFNKRVYSIAAVSDCQTTGLRSRTKSHEFNFNIVLYSLMTKIRSYIMPVLEYKSLKDYDRIFLQTEKDKNELNKYTKNKLSSKIRIVTNGVNEKLFDVQNIYSNNFLYVGMLNSVHYQECLLWLYNDVWKTVSKTYIDSKMYIYSGGSLPKGIFDEMLLDDSIIFINKFVNNIEDIYTGKSICFAPIFKDNGFMNKVAEAITSGLIVIGDSTAFNGINNYKHDKNVLIADTAKEFIQEIDRIILNKKKWVRMNKEAKILANSEFHWRNKIYNLDVIKDSREI